MANILFCVLESYLYRFKNNIRRHFLMWEINQNTLVPVVFPRTTLHMTNSYAQYSTSATFFFLMTRKSGQMRSVTYFVFWLRYGALGLTTISTYIRSFKINTTVFLKIRIEIFTIIVHITAARIPLYYPTQNHSYSSNGRHCRRINRSLPTRRLI